MVYKSTRNTEPFSECVKGGVSQAKSREATDGKEASKVEKLRNQLEKAQQELESIADAAENADANEQDHLRAKADKQRAHVSDTEVALGQLLRGRPLTLEEYDSEIMVR